MKFLHSMVRVKDLDESLKFYRDLLGLKLVRKNDYPQGKFTLAYLATEEGEPEVELTHNWDSNEDYGNARNFGHLAFQVKNIYEMCQHLQDNGVTILRPPRDGYMAFIKSPDGISIELLQEGEALAAQEPWASMENTGSW
jgi:lactoylglutathione lyase